MPSGSDKWIRSLRENAAGKVVSEDGPNRWEWQSDDETARQLKKLTNDSLAIERTDLRSMRKASSRKDAEPLPRSAQPDGFASKPGSRDAGGGFNPYDHSPNPKPKRR